MAIARISKKELRRLEVLTEEYSYSFSLMMVEIVAYIGVILIPTPATRITAVTMGMIVTMMGWKAQSRMKKRGYKTASAKPEYWAMQILNIVLFIFIAIDFYPRSAAIIQLVMTTLSFIMLLATMSLVQRAQDHDLI